MTHPVVYLLLPVWWAIGLAILFLLLEERMKVAWLHVRRPFDWIADHMPRRRKARQ